LFLLLPGLAFAQVLSSLTGAYLAPYGSKACFASAGAAYTVAGIPLLGFQLSSQLVVPGTADLETGPPTLKGEAEFLRTHPAQEASPAETVEYQTEWTKQLGKGDILGALMRNRPSQEHARVAGYSLHRETNGDMVWHVSVFGLRHVSPAYEKIIRSEFASFATKGVVIDYDNSLPTILR
jgi:hypothetical protein